LVAGGGWLIDLVNKIMGRIFGSPLARRLSSSPPLWGGGRPPKRIAGGRGGGRCEARHSRHNNDPHPQPLPTRGRGADRVCRPWVPDLRALTRARPGHSARIAKRNSTCRRRRG